MFNKLDKNAERIRRHLRIRKKMSGTATRPRLDVYRSKKSIYAQVIDDVNGKTLVAVNTLQKDISEQIENKTKTEASKVVGKVIAEKCLEKGINEVVFDRGGYLYTGRVKAIAEGAREAGLKF